MPIKINYILAQICIFIFCFTAINGQVKFSGTWKGFELSDPIQSTYGEVYFIDFVVINGLLEGKMRVENNQKEVKLLDIKGTKKYIDFTINEKRIRQTTTKQKNTKLDSYTFKYNLERGYLEGSKNDSSSTSKIVLFKSKFDFSTKLKPSKNKNWITSILWDYNNGLSSPEKRLEELKDFHFEPIYFDYDKSNVKEEYHEQLKEIKKIVLSHSDLRILVSGHTDSDGSNSYNQKLK